MIKEFCGLFGTYNSEEASLLTFLGLYSLQHRGEESCGIISFDGTTFNAHLGMGLVSDVFSESEVAKLKGFQAIGHVRYSTTGSSALRNAQPLFVDSGRLPIALAHNGNLVNSKLLREQLESKGAIFQTTSDSELILHLIMHSKKKLLEEKIADALKKIKGAFSLLLMTRDNLIGIRDPLGIRPLCIGRKDDVFFISSESCALDLVGAKFLREIEAGELVTINKKGITSHKYTSGQGRCGFCAFEHVYFARPDSIIFGETVHLVREKLGRELTKEHPVKADIIIGVPDSGISAALGFSKESGIPLEVGIIRNHYIGRTFIQPQQEKREFGVKLKFNMLKEVIKGKKVVIVDDSIVRGTTSKIRVNNFHDMGAKEIHLRISCPPHKFGCFYGIDFPDPRKLIAHDKSVKEIEKYLGVDSLGYLSLEGMLSCFKNPKNYYCTACWSGNYPIQFKSGDKYVLEKGESHEAYV
ncbi:MAG: amidophosphoribosyltransferase [Candidatus Omnitrophota bacterium]|nr:amidophosphoribosyltransferase [Candidatus Omnitrophota bacterium]